MTQTCSITPLTDGARVTGSYLQPLLETALERGLTLPALAEAAGLAPGALEPLPESLPARRYIGLLEAGARLANDPFFGLHVGEKARPATYRAYGLLLLASSSFGHALELSQRYESLAHDLGRSRVTQGGAHAHYEWVSHYPDATRHLVESVYAGIRVFGSWLAGRPLMPLALRLRHADPGHGDAEYLRVLGIAPEFAAPLNCAAVDAALLAMPVPNADTSLYPLLQQHAERLLEQRATREEPIVVRVRAALLPRLAGGEARLAPVAAELGLSPRTLQRKLAGAGSSFQQVLDAVRYGLARDYLRRRELGLVDIAFLLGFREQSAFTHAFREWSGVNPGAWREQAA
ncbi:AraC-like DNA-binding protein/transcriptional regulator with XRE-family HTH domain [Massilia sp. UYP11]|uniref:AraC family transcriptional regulator n=1 Tax=Massilia sp. UYP11 TaxID=1756385 RepID=UPI003D260F11